jgi:small-conductance mechanosensitive channel
MASDRQDDTSPRVTHSLFEYSFLEGVLASIFGLLVAVTALVAGENWGIPGAFSIICTSIIFGLPLWAYLNWKRQPTETFEASRRRSVNLVVPVLFAIPLMFVSASLVSETYPRLSGRIMTATALVVISLVVMGAVRLIRALISKFRP